MQDNAVIEASNVIYGDLFCDEWSSTWHKYLLQITKFVSLTKYRKMTLKPDKTWMVGFFRDSAIIIMEG